MSSIMVASILTLALALASASTQDSHGYRIDGSNSELEKLDQLFRIGDREQYDRRQTPSYSAGTPTQVHIQMYIRSFGSINPIQMDYTVDLYLRQWWLELRFLNNSLTRPLDLNDPILVKMLWKPEVYFPNAKDSDFQYVTVPNVMLRIHPDGTILYILRLKVKFSCMMDLSSFPLDHQTCYIQLASFVKTTRELELVWYQDSPVKMYKRLQLPQFQLKEITVDTCSQSFHIGNYSCLQAVFELRRNIGYHLVQSYLPTSLIVVVSWVSFWLDVDAIPSRVTLGVTTLLTVCSESTSFRDKMPTVSYVKALDIWMGSCTAFVFLALVEFTVVHHMARHHRRFLFWSCRVYGDGRSRELPLDQRPSKGSSLQAAASQGPASLTPTQRATEHVSETSVTLVTVESRDNAGESSSGSRNTSAGHDTRPNGAGESSSVSRNTANSDNRQVSEFCHAGVHAPAAGDVKHDMRSGEGQPVDGDASVTTCYPHNEDDACARAFSDMGLTCLPSLWHQEVVLAKRIDKMCRAIFPALFLLFNLVYWLYYQVFT